MIHEIHTKELVKNYRNRMVVNHVSIDVKQGEIVGLLGPNGAGKTTTFYMVVGLIKPDGGKVFLDNEEITRLPMFKRAQMGIGYLPQEASVFRKLSVENNLLSVLEMTNLTRAERREKLEALLDEFHLHHVRKNNGDSLSGGERRRTEIARALAVDPKFILLDEPFAGVDPIAVEDIQAVVARLKYRNIGILITDHNVNETLSICDRAYLLIEGKIFKHGTAEELAADEQVRRLYLGRNFELKRKDWLLEQGREAILTEKHRLSDYVQWMIDQVAAVLDVDEQRPEAPSFQKFQDPGQFREFCTSYYNVISTVEEFALDKKLPKILEYTGLLKDIKIEDQLHSNPGDAVATVMNGNPMASNLFNNEKFLDALRQAKEYFEKCKMVIDNPEFAKVLS